MKGIHNNNVVLLGAVPILKALPPPIHFKIRRELKRKMEREKEEEERKKKRERKRSNRVNSGHCVRQHMAHSLRSDQNYDAYNWGEGFIF